MKTFVSKLSGCGRFETRVHKDHLDHVMQERRRLRLDSPITVRLASAGKGYEAAVRDLVQRLAAQRQAA